MVDLPVKKLKINGTEFSPVINVDSTPAEGSTNPITSGGIYSELENIPKLNTENTFIGDNNFTGEFRAYSNTGTMTLISTGADTRVGGKVVTVATTDHGSGEISIAPGEISISATQPDGYINLAAPEINLKFSNGNSAEYPALNLTGESNNITIFGSDETANLTIDVPDVTVDGNLSITSGNSVTFETVDSNTNTVISHGMTLYMSLKHIFPGGYHELQFGSGEVALNSNFDTKTYYLSFPTSKSGTVALVSDITTAISNCASDLTKLDESGNYTIKDVVTTLNKLLTLLGAQSPSAATSES